MTITFRIPFSRRIQQAALLALACFSCFDGNQVVGQVRVESPNQEVAIDFFLDPLNHSSHYRVTFQGEQIIEPSALALKFQSQDAAGGLIQGGPISIQSVESSEVKEVFEQVTGKRRQVQVLGNKKTIRIEHSDLPKQA